MAAADVRKHPLGFGVLHYRFAGDAGKVIDFLDRPAIPFSVFACALFMMLWAFALGLVFR